MRIGRRALPPHGWRRTLAVRRAAAAVLVVVAAVLALRPGAAAPAGRVVVAAHDLAPGVALAEPDLVGRAVPEELVPAGAVTDPVAVRGRLLVGGVRAGEAITDVRLLGTESAVAAVGVPDAAGVGVRLADPAVAALLGPGTRVDVVGAGATGGTAGAGDAIGPDGAGPSGPGGAGSNEPVVLAGGAMVLGVLPSAERGATGPVVVVALPAPVAARVAAATLGEEVTVTVR